LRKRRDHDQRPHRHAESDWEDFALEVLADLGWELKTGHDTAPGSGERESWKDLAQPPASVATTQIAASLHRAKCLTLGAE
jgi:hypothetical protein